MFTLNFPDDIIVWLGLWFDSGWYKIGMCSGPWGKALKLEFRTNFALELEHNARSLTMRNGMPVPQDLPGITNHPLQLIVMKYQVRPVPGSSGGCCSNFVSWAPILFSQNHSETASYSANVCRQTTALKANCSEPLSSPLASCLVSILFYFCFFYFVTPASIFPLTL